MFSSHRQLRTCSSPIAGAERRGAPLQAHPQLSYWKCFLARCCERESKKKQIFKQNPCSKLPCLIQPPDSFTFSCFGDFFFFKYHVATCALLHRTGKWKHQLFKAAVGWMEGDEPGSPEIATSPIELQLCLVTKGPGGIKGKSQQMGGLLGASCQLCSVLPPWPAAKVRGVNVRGCVQSCSRALRGCCGARCQA